MQWHNEEKTKPHKMYAIRCNAIVTNQKEDTERYFLTTE